MENFNDKTQEQQQLQTQQPLHPQQHIIQKLIDMPITDENAALNILVGFIDVAQKRAVFNLEESHKIWECIKKFQVKK